MKLSTNTDFTKLPRAGAVRQAGGGVAEPFDTVALDHDERRLRRKVLTLSGGGQILVDHPETVSLGDGDLLVLDDGRFVRIEAATEELCEVRAGTMPLLHLAWHLGSRHVVAQIDEDRILIKRDPAIRAMLEDLGAAVQDVVASFRPVQGVEHAHTHHHDEKPDRFGRLPGDPHYGHNHP